MSPINTHIIKKDLYTFIGACLFLVVALFLPTSIALIITSLFFVVFSFFKPFQSLLFLVLYVSIRPILIEMNPGLKLVGDIIILIAFAKLLISSKLNLKSLLTFKWFEWIYFAFLIFGSIIGLLNDVSISSVIFQLRTFLIMYLIYYVLSRSILPSSWLERLAWVTVFTSWLVSIHGIIEKLSMRQWLLPDVWKYKTLSATNIVRIYGLPGNPNSLALLLMFGIAAALLLTYLYKNKSYKIFLNISLVLFMGVFVMTYSRGTWISAIVLAVIFILLSKEWKLLKRLVIAGVASFILVYLPVNWGLSLFQSFGLEAPKEDNGSITGRIGATFDQDNINLMTESGRIFYLKKGFEVFSDYPLTGSGFGTFGGAATLSYGSPIYDNYGIRSDIYGGKNFYSDNQYIQVIAETGVMGVLLFAGFLIGMLALLWKERHTIYGKFMIGLWFSTGFSGFYYNIWELKGYTVFFFLIFGCFAAMQKWYPKIEFKDR